MKGVTLEMLRGPGVESIMIDGRLFGSLPSAGRLSEPPLPDKPKLVVFAHEPLGTFTIPVRLESEANTGGKLRAAIGRKKAVKQAVWRALGPYWRVLGPVGDAIRANRKATIRDAIRANRKATIRVTRLGGRGLDTGNLWRAVKPVEDALAVLLGCDDGWPGWKAAFDLGQEPGERWGIRISLAAQ